jgi:hypothetical protein
MTSKTMSHSGRIFLVLFLSLLIATVSSGCIKIVQRSIAGGEQAAGSDVSVTKGNSSDAAAIQIPTETANPVTSLETAQNPTTTPSQPPLVAETAPIVENNPYPALHTTRINETSEYAQRARKPEFEKTYTLRYNAIGLLVNVTKGPLMVYFDVNPVYDCLDNPDSCRGSPMASVNPPYLTITIRDNETRVIVAQDGYGGEYSSQKSNRTVTVYGEGRYHITLEGNSVDVTLSISTGTSPYMTDTTGSSGTAQASPSQSEYLRFIRQRLGGL